MAKKKKILEKYLTWIEAGKRFHLSDVHIQMALPAVTVNDPFRHLN
jgi:hypothetical protein